MLLYESLFLIACAIGCSSTTSMASDSIWRVFSRARLACGIRRTFTANRPRRRRCWRKSPLVRHYKILPLLMQSATIQFYLVPSSSPRLGTLVVCIKSARSPTMEFGPNGTASSATMYVILFEVSMVTPDFSLNGSVAAQSYTPMEELRRRV